MSFKILQVIPKLGYGGAETGCYDIAHYLAEKNCKSYIITSGGPLLKFIKKNKVKIIRLPVHSKNPILMFLNTILITFIIIFLRIDIVHARSRAPAWSCLISCKLTRTKFVTTFHGIYNFSNNLKKFYNSVMVRSNLIIAGSNYVFDHIHKNYGSLINRTKRLLVIFRGINTEYFDNSNITNEKVQNLNSLLNLNTEKIKILLPGRLTRWKGKELFIESLNLLKTSYNKNNFQVIVLGSHQGRKVYYKKLLSLVDKLNLKRDVFFLQHFKEMPVVYYVSDIVVSSSIEPEAFGRVSVEAQAMRRPILASNHGGSIETVIDGKTGFLFKNNNPNSLAENLNKLMEMDKDKLQSIGNEGRKNVLKKFDVEKMCDSTFSEYKKLIK
jgi:glycosyltransferase involved in cell wall biosynthesis